jgi:hypothetical protein
MKGTSHGFDNGFLDRPEQGECISQISACRPQGMLKLLRMEDPVRRVVALEFIGPCRIDADIRPISTQSGPEFSVTLAEGEGRASMFSQQEAGPAKEAVNHLNWERRSVGRGGGFPKRTSRRHKMIQQDGDEVVLVPQAARDFGGAWCGCIEDRSPSMNETHGMNHYSLAVLCHIHSHLSRSGVQKSFYKNFPSPGARPP